MQADIEQLKTQIQTPESDPAKAIDLATQIIAQDRFHYLVLSYWLLQSEDKSDWIRAPNINLKT